MRTLAPRYAVALSAALVLVGGCGGNPKPAPATEPTKAPSATASASPSPPVMPEAARAKTKAGAIAFARHYVDLINHAQATGDVAGLQRVETPSCESCQRAAAYVRDLYESGGSIKGGAFRVRSVNALRNPATRGWLVELGVEFGPQVVDHPGTQADEHPKGGKLPLNVQVAQRGAEWKVLQWTRGA